MNEAEVRPIGKWINCSWMRRAERIKRLDLSWFIAGRSLCTISVQGRPLLFVFKSFSMPFTRPTTLRHMFLAQGIIWREPNGFSHRKMCGAHRISSPSSLFPPSEYEFILKWSINVAPSATRNKWEVPMIDSWKVGPITVRETDETEK